MVIIIIITITVGGHVCHGVTVEDREYLYGVCSFLILHGFQKENSCCKVPTH